MGMVKTTFSVLCGNRAPAAKADSNWVQEYLFGIATGNVLKSIVHNAPPPPFGTFADVADTDPVGNALKVTSVGTFNLKYGILVLKSDGSYTYTLYTAAQNLAAYNAVQKLTGGETLKENPFTYGVSDGTLKANSTLSLTVFGRNDPVNISGIGLTGGDKVVFENDLANGTSPHAPSLTKSGTFNIFATDGVDDLRVGGTLVIENGTVKNLNTAIATADGIIKITGINLATGTVSYSYTLNKNALHAPGGGDNSFVNSLFDKIAVKLTDRDGSSKTSSINVKIIDDRPEASHVVDPDVIDDEAQSGGIADGVDDVAGAIASTTGLLGYKAGADGLKTLVLTGPATLGAEAVSSIWNPATNTLTISSVARGLIATVVVTNLVTGAYTVTFSKPVLHEKGLDENDATLTVGYSVTDKDGDSATGSLKVTVDDDTPTIAFTTQDVCIPSLAVDDSDLTIDASAYIANLFDSNPGADGQASLTYALDVKSPGVDSGLVDTASKLAIVLTLEGGAVVGRAGPGGPIAFTLTIDATTGQITLDQQLAVVHDDITNPNDLKTLIDDVVKLTATIVDNDGDSASTTLDIGGNLFFYDAGPSVAANCPVNLEDEYEHEDGSGDHYDESYSASSDSSDMSSASGTLGFSFGADGAGSVAFLDTGAPSGFSFVTVSGGLEVFQGAAKVLTLTLDAINGAYTVNLEGSLDHTNCYDESEHVIAVQYRVTDNDGDSVDGSLVINIDEGSDDDGESEDDGEDQYVMLTADTIVLNSEMMSVSTCAPSGSAEMEDLTCMQADYCLSMAAGAADAALQDAIAGMAGKASVLPQQPGDFYL